MLDTIKVVRKAGAGTPLLRGLAVAGLWLAAGALILSLLLRFGGLQEASLPGAAWAVHMAAALAGGFAVGRRSGSKGWFHGAVLGVCYGITVQLIGFLAADASISLHGASIAAASAGAGAVGGMLGISTAR